MHPRNRYATVLNFPEQVTLLPSDVRWKQPSNLWGKWAGKSRSFMIWTVTHGSCSCPILWSQGTLPGAFTALHHLRKGRTPTVGDFCSLRPVSHNRIWICLVDGFLSLAVELLDLGSSSHIPSQSHKVKYWRFEINNKNPKNTQKKARLRRSLAFRHLLSFAVEMWRFCHCDAFRVKCSNWGQCLFSARPSNLQMAANCEVGLKYGRKLGMILLQGHHLKKRFNPTLEAGLQSWVNECWNVRAIKGKPSMWLP